ADQPPFRRRKRRRLGLAGARKGRCSRPVPHSERFRSTPKDCWKAASVFLSSLLPATPSISPGEKSARSSSISSFMIVAALGARSRLLPDGEENCALSMACASSAGVAACEAARLACEAPCLAACAASATSNAAQKSVAAPAPRAQRPIRNVPSIERPSTTRRAENAHVGGEKASAFLVVLKKPHCEPPQSLD